MLAEKLTPAAHAGEAQASSAASGNSIGCTPKLYAVTAQVMLVIQAESEKGAMSDAVLYAAQAASDGVGINSADEIRNVSDLPPGWTVADLPFGGNGAARIGTILADMPPIVVRDTRTIDMFEVQT